MNITRHNPKLEIINSDNKRTEYLMKGQRVSVGNQDRYEFETAANKFLDGSDRYNKFKANHSLGTAMIGLMNLLLIGGATYGGVKGAKVLMEKFASKSSKTLKTCANIAGGMIGFIAGSQVAQYTGVPGRRAMKQGERQLNALDVYFPEKR